MIETERLPPIRHFNTNSYGGAATAARKIHDSLVASGIDSRFYFVDGDSDGPNYEKLRLDPRFGVWGRLFRSALHRFRQRVGSAGSAIYEPFGWPTIPGRALDLSVVEPASILHLHWVVGLLDYRSFFRGVPVGTPIVWTLHDMNPLTGGCHYAWSCTGFVDQCRHCPQLAGLAGIAMAIKSQDLKKQALSHRNLHIVANSRWLEEEAGKSRIFDSARSFRTIHLGVDPEAFRPRDPLAARRRLGLDESRTIVAFGSARLDTPRKGFRELCESLSRLEAKNTIEVLTFGERGSADGPAGITWRHIGPIHSTEKLATLYNAADIFVMPSRQEAFGQTALEALACATPVVAFDVGGVPDMVRPNQTGLLARVGDVEDLSGQIYTLVGDPEQRLRLGRNGRRLIEAEFSLDHQKHGYLDLYRHLAGD